MGAKSFTIKHWPEYLIEGSLLGSFMVAVGFLITAFESPRSALYTLLPGAELRAVLLALTVGGVLALLIHSPWGKRSGAHMNPAITLAFLWLKKIAPGDALLYVLAQTLGAIAGVFVVAFFAGSLYTDPPVHYALTLPGEAGEATAFVAETVMSCALMAAVLFFTSSPRLMRFTGIVVGALVALFIIVEAPLSGTSMNPARTLASAVRGMLWQHLWIYLLGPTLGMLLAAELHRCTHQHPSSGCAKLLHPSDVPCIHCGLRD
jgi:aquaporin Z